MVLTKGLAVKSIRVSQKTYDWLTKIGRRSGGRGARAGLKHIMTRFIQHETVPELTVERLRRAGL